MWRFFQFEHANVDNTGQGRGHQIQQGNARRSNNAPANAPAG